MAFCKTIFLEEKAVVYEADSLILGAEQLVTDAAEELIKKSPHYHYLITFKDREEPKEIARILEIRSSKPSLNYIQELERKYKFAKVLSITELECDCEK